MSEVPGDRSLGGEPMRITVVGVLAIVGAVAVVLLLLRYLENENNSGPTQDLPGPS